jgi:tetratricopeptide (TPR) repeat protein
MTPVASRSPSEWRALGARLHAAGDRAGAAQAFARYLSMPPADPALRMIAAAIARRDHAGAWGQLQAFVAAQPGDLLAYRMLGQIALATGRGDAAEAIFRRLLTFVPDFAPVQFELAGALFGQGKAAATLDTLAPLLARAPADPGARAMRAAALAKLGDFAAAAAIQAKLTAEHPRHVAGWVAYGQSLRALRRSDDAAVAFRRAVAVAPGHGAAWWNLANLKTGALDAADASNIEAALAAPATRAEDRFHLRFALARAREDAGDFAAAFETYVVANRERRALLPPGPDNVARAAALGAAFNPARRVVHAGSDGGSDAAIFIIGMPRSGSTLLEQILASHPDIEGMGELPDLPIVAGAQDLAALSGEQVQKIGRDYLARIAAQRKTARRLFVDKLPANWLNVPLIRLALPNARIIDMRRDALACCLSMFRQHFASGAGFTYAIDSLAAEYRAYVGLMARVDAVAPGAVKRVELEALVADTEAVVRDVLDFVGVPFAPQCLRFFESDRAVFTPSSEQVRRPINDDSAAIMAGFAPYVGDLRVALGDVAQMRLGSD